MVNRELLSAKLEFLEFINSRLRELQLEKEQLNNSFVNRKTGFVYFIKSLRGNYKIGRSKDPDLRFLQLQTDPSNRLTLVHKVYTDDMVQLEALVHQVFELSPHKRIEREWFEIDERHANFRTWLGSNEFLFWNDYEIDLRLIENNCFAYKKLLRETQAEVEICE